MAQPAAGGGGGTPTFISATRVALGTVADGDLVLVFALVAPGGTPITAPTGFTQRFSATESTNGYHHQVFSAIHSASNATVGITAFPFGSGYLFSMVYRNVSSVLQVGTLGEVGATTANLTVPALSSSTGSNSFLLGWSSSRDPAAVQTSDESMTNRMVATETFFQVNAWEQAGVRSGARNFTRSNTANNFTGLLVEIG